MRAGSKLQVGRCPLCRPYAGEEEARESERALDLARSGLQPWPWGWGRRLRKPKTEGRERSRVDSSQHIYWSFP